MRGPLPYAGYISNICEAFGCTPAEAERQDARLVDEIITYRNARVALAAMDAKDVAVFEQHPNLLTLLSKMTRAQLGMPMDQATEGEGEAVVAKHIEEAEAEEPA